METRDVHLGGLPRSRHIRVLPAVVGALVIGIGLSACGSSNSSGTSSASSSSSSGGDSAGVATATKKLKEFEVAPTKIIQTQPLKSPPPSGKTVVMLGTPDPGNVLIQKGLANIAKMVGWNYSQVSYDPANPGSFNSALDTALSKHPDYVAEAGLPLTAQAIKKVQEAGAKWVVTATYPVTVKPPVIAATNAYANNARMGEALAYYFVAASKGKGNAVVEHVPSYPILGGFTDAFQKTTKSLCPACQIKLVNLTLPQVTSGKIPSAMVSALRANPSADYLVFDYGPFANGISSALSAAGLSNIKILGQAADASAIAELKSGKQAAWTGFQPGYQSYAMFDAMFRDVEGLPINQTEAALQPTQILTHDNIDSVNITDGFWAEPADAPDQFKALWRLQ
jgi:ribose transport system substrate-binding protein